MPVSQQTHANQQAPILAPPPSQVAHYLVLSQLDESLLANITDNVNSLQPLLDREVARRVDAAKRQRNERDEG